MAAGHEVRVKRKDEQERPQERVGVSSKTVCMSPRSESLVRSKSKDEIDMIICPSLQRYIKWTKARASLRVVSKEILHGPVFVSTSEPSDDVFRRILRVKGV